MGDTKVYETLSSFLSAPVLLFQEKGDGKKSHVHYCLVITKKGDDRGRIITPSNLRNGSPAPRGKTGRRVPLHGKEKKGSRFLFPFGKDSSEGGFLGEGGGGGGGGGVGVFFGGGGFLGGGGGGGCCSKKGKKGSVKEEGSPPRSGTRHRKKRRRNHGRACEREGKEGGGKGGQQTTRECAIQISAGGANRCSALDTERGRGPSEWVINGKEKGGSGSGTQDVGVFVVEEDDHLPNWHRSTIDKKKKKTPSTTFTPH